MSRRLLCALGAVVLLAALLAPRPAAAWCWWSCNNNYTKTKYPIVLAHGFMGFDTALGIMDYWYGIVDELEDGGATVYVTEVSLANSSEARGEQLIAQLEEIRAIEGKPNLKFNLIGHSQGGLDIRYVAGVRPDLVASLTGVAAPHLGVDIIEALGGTDILPQALVNFLGGAFDLMGILMGNTNPNDVAAALAMFDPAVLADFNARFPGGMPAAYCGEGEAVTQTSAGPIRNYSWVGSSVLTNPFDILDPLFGLTSLMFDEANDGLVEACSAHFGHVIRDNYRMNHLDEVNQLFGIVSWFETDPKSVFRTHANRLKNAGL